MMNLRSTYPQLSIWSTSHDSNSQHEQHTFDKSIQNNNRSSYIHYFDHVTNADSTDNEKQKYHLSMRFFHYCSSMSTCLQGLVLGVLICGLILSIIIALWLTSSNTTKTTTNTVTEVLTVSPVTVMATTTTSTVPSVSTTASTTMVSTTLNTISASTTIISSSSNTVTSSTLTIITSSSSTIITSTASSTLTSTSCSTPTSTIFYFNGAPSSYTQETYNYTASTTGTAVLQFGFTSISANKYAFLDDVSILDTNASNSEMLINGDFENGTLVGWQVICTSSCSGASLSVISTAPCYSGSFCYADECKGGLDFLQQAFTITIGHIYTLNFWLEMNSGVNVYVTIF